MLSSPWSLARASDGVFTTMASTHQMWVLDLWEKAFRSACVLLNNWPRYRENLAHVLF